MAGDAPREIHLLVIIHGLWGSTSHVQSIVKTIQAAYDEQASSSNHELRVLCAKTNESDLTYDGVDINSIRVLQEIDEFIEDARPEQAVTRFSIVGYSLGGLIARAVLGALEARQPSFFDTIEPVNFTTFASPAVGIPQFPTYLSRLVNWFGPRVLSRSGAQLYATDDFMAGRPLLEIMSQPDTSFYKALQRFQKKQVYANTVNDRTVPFPTAYFPENHMDPFARADRIARRYAEDPDALKVNLELGGLLLTFKKDCPHIIESIQSIKPPLETTDDSSKRWRWPSLPFFLRPSTFSALPYGLGYIVPFLMPLLIPSFIVYILARFMIQSHKSQKRIRSLHSGDLSTIEGRLRRVGLALEDTFEEIAEDVFPLSGDSEELTETDPIFTPSQKRMIQNLNAIPGLEKIMVYLPQERNSHGAIICRNPSFDGHRKGLEVLKWWSDRFIF